MNVNLAIITFIPSEKRKPVSRVIHNGELKDNGYSITHEGMFQYLTLFVNQGAKIVNVEYSPHFHNLPEYPILLGYW